MVFGSVELWISIQIAEMAQIRQQRNGQTVKTAAQAFDKMWS
jgi:hypothetical protein